MAGRNARAPQHRRPDTTPCNSQKLPAGRSSNANVTSSKFKTMEYCYALVTAGVSLVLYYNTLGADFAYDDSRAIKTNQDLIPTTPIGQLFYNDFWGTPLVHSGSHKSYRPLCVLTFRLNYALGGLEPWGYHLFNVLLHAMVSALFTQFASLVFSRSPVPTLTAGLLFATHPIHTEAVAGVVGRADVGACLFFLLSLMSYMRYCKYRDKRRFLYLCLLLAAASMLTKEHGLTVLLLCAVYDTFIVHKLHPKELIVILTEKRFGYLREGLFHLIGAAIGLVALRFHLMGRKPPDFAPADNPASDNDSLITRTLTFLYLPAFNFWLLLCPRWLSFDWSMESIPLLTSPLDPRNALTVCFYAAGFRFLQYISRSLAAQKVTAVLWNQRKNYRNGGGPYNNNNHSYANGHHRTYNGHSAMNGNSLSAAMYHQASSVSTNPMDSYHQTPPGTLTDTVIMATSLLALPFVPASNLFFYVGFVVAERVLYIPSMGFCILVAIGVNQLYRKQEARTRRKVVLGVVLILMAVMSLRTVRRNRDWWHEENLYRSGININPPKAYGNLANILSSQGKKLEAEWAYKKALSYRSNMADVHYNLGILQQEQGRYDEALQSYKLAIQFRPRLAMAHLNLGLVLGILGRKDEAAEVYRRCAELDSSGLKDPKMHETTKISALFNLGRLYADNGSYREAIDVYQEAVHKMPEHYQPQSLYNMMGEAFFKMKQYEEAERWYMQALKAKSDHIPAHLTYAKLLSKWGKPKEAEEWFLKAKTLAPNDSSVYQHYGQFLSESERHVEAAEVYLRAAELAPDEYEIIFNAANTLRQASRNADAEHFYQLAVKLRPNEVTSHMNLGAMLHVNGKLLEAESSYLEALKLKPDDPITQNNLQKLRNLLSQKKLNNRR